MAKCGAVTWELVEGLWVKVVRQVPTKPGSRCVGTHHERIVSAPILDRHYRGRLEPPERLL